MKKIVRRVFLTLLFVAVLAAAGMSSFSCAPASPADDGTGGASPPTFSEASSDGTPSEDETGEESAGGLMNGGNYEWNH